MFDAELGGDFPLVVFADHVPTVCGESNPGCDDGEMMFPAGVRKRCAAQHEVGQLNAQSAAR